MKAEAGAGAGAGAETGTGERPWVGKLGVKVLVGLGFVAAISGVTAVLVNAGDVTEIQTQGTTTTQEPSPSEPVETIIPAEDTAEPTEEPTEEPAEETPEPTPTAAPTAGRPPAGAAHRKSASEAQTVGEAHQETAGQTDEKPPVKPTKKPAPKPSPTPSGVDTSDLGVPADPLDDPPATTPPPTPPPTTPPPPGTAATADEASATDRHPDRGEPLAAADQSPRRGNPPEQNAPESSEETPRKAIIASLGHRDGRPGAPHPQADDERRRSVDTDGEARRGRPTVERHGRPTVEMAVNG